MSFLTNFECLMEIQEALLGAVICLGRLVGWIFVIFLFFFFQKKITVIFKDTHIFMSNGMRQFSKAK